MAKKAELLEQAQKLKLEVTEKNTIAEIQAALDSAPSKQSPVTSEDDTLETKEKGQETALAKAGKRSEKGQKEAEEKQEKIDRQKHASEAKAEQSDIPKQPIKPARSRLERRGKKFRKASEEVDTTKHYPLAEAIDLALKTSPTKFDATVEIHVRLGVDPRQADQNLRDNIVLPSGTGKSVRVAVFAEEDVAKDAIKAGADVAGYEDFLKQLDKGEINFDVLISTPNVMAKLSKYARILGPKGLMPNPKSGTVTKEVNKAISQSKAGKVEYRVDSTGIVHLGIGKVSFGNAKIQKNTEAVFTSLKANKPASLKGTYVKSITLTTTMGPGVKVLISELS